MAKVYEFLANGFEEVEMMTPLIVFRHAGMELVTVSIYDDTLFVETAHGVTVKADVCFKDCNFNDADLLVMPGGLPGAPNLLEFKPLAEVLRKHYAAGKRIGAICAAPMVLGQNGFLEGKRATCYPGFEEFLTGAEIVDEQVVVDGLITTAKGPGCAFPFAFTLLSQFMEKDKVEQLIKDMQYYKNAQFTI